jgi:hypothetical protein
VTHHVSHVLKLLNAENVHLATTLATMTIVILVTLLVQHVQDQLLSIVQTVMQIVKLALEQIPPSAHHALMINILLMVTMNVNAIVDFTQILLLVVLPVIQVVPHAQQLVPLHAQLAPQDFITMEPLIALCVMELVTNAMVQVPMPVHHVQVDLT